METQTKLPSFQVAENNPNLIYFSDGTFRPIHSIRIKFRDIRVEYHKQMNFSIGTFPESVKMTKQYFLESYGIPFDAWNYLEK